MHTGLGVVVIGAYDWLSTNTYLTLRWVYAAQTTSNAKAERRTLELLDAAVWSRSTEVVLCIVFLTVQAGGAHLRHRKLRPVQAAAYMICSALAQAAVAIVALAGTVLVALAIDVLERGAGADVLPGGPSAWRWAGVAAVATALGAVWIVAYSAARVVAALTAAPALIQDKTP